MRIFVGNLSYATDSDELRRVFSSYGEVRSAEVVEDRMTGRSRGFGFVEMSNPSEAQTAIRALNGANLGGRPWTVNEARPREERFPRRPVGGHSGR